SLPAPVVDIADPSAPAAPSIPADPSIPPEPAEFVLPPEPPALAVLAVPMPAVAPLPDPEVALPSAESVAPEVLLVGPEPSLSPAHARRSPSATAKPLIEPNRWALASIVREFTAYGKRTARSDRIGYP